MSLANWFRADFNFPTLPLRAWIEVIIRASNNLLDFILNTGFCDKYKFLNFPCNDPMISLSYVS